MQINKGKTANQREQHASTKQTGSDNIAIDQMLTEGLHGWAKIRISNEVPWCGQHFTHP